MNLGEISTANEQDDAGLRKGRRLIDVLPPWLVITGLVALPLLWGLAFLVAIGGLGQSVALHHRNDSYNWGIVTASLITALIVEEVARAHFSRRRLGPARHRA